MSKKRRREQVTAQSQNVEIFEDLAHDDAEIRLKAAEKLLSSISEDKSPSRSDVETILNRLIRGLCSSRKAARFGYAIALTELLVQLWGPDATQGTQLELSIPDILTLIEKQTEISANAPSAEVKDHCFGRLFAEEAVVKSAILFQGKADDTQWKRVLDVVFSLAKRKSWLRELCGWTLYQALDVIQGQPKAERYVRALVKKLPDDGFSETPEGVAIWLKALHLAVDVKMPKGVWHKKNPLHPKELAKLAAILKESASTDEPKKDKNAFKSRGTWSSNLHFVWEEIISHILNPDPRFDKETAKAKDVTFEKFWAVAVDGSLFATPSSDERKYWGYLLFQQYLLKADQDNILALFGEHFLRCLVTHISSSDHALCPMAQKCLATLNLRAIRDPSSLPILVDGLLRAASCTNFDKLIRTQDIEKLIANGDSSALQRVLGKFDQLILNPQTEDDRIAAFRRQLIANVLVAVFRSRSTEMEWPFDRDSPEMQILLILIVHAYFSSRASIDGAEITPHPPLSKETRKLFGARFISCLTTLLTQRNDSVKSVVYLLKAIDSLETGRGSKRIERLCSEIASSEIRKTQANWIFSRRTESNAPNSEIMKALDLLIAVTTLQAYGDDEDAVNLLGELAECARDIQSCEETLVSVKIIEVLLTLISKPSVFAMKLVTRVFPACTSSVTEEGLMTLLKVLDTEESVNGQIELFEGADEALENGVIQDGGSDVEMVDSEEASSPSEGSGSDSDQNAEEDEAADSEELATFNAKLAEALGTRPGEEDLKAAESTGSDDDDMDDEQMEALDSTLEKVFRERAKVPNRKNQAKEARQNVALFKSRVLELLDLYVKQEYANGLCVKMVIPLLQSMRKTKNKQVSEKLFNLLREYNKRYKLKNRLKNFGDMSNRNNLLPILEEIHDEAVHGDYANLYQSACSQASMLMAKILIANSGSDTDFIMTEIGSVYAQTQSSFFKDVESSVRPAFFLDWVNWMTSNRKTISDSLTANGHHDDATEAPRQARRYGKRPCG